MRLATNFISVFQASEQIYYGNTEGMLPAWPHFSVCMRNPYESHNTLSFSSRVPDGECHHRTHRWRIARGSLLLCRKRGRQKKKHLTPCWHRILPFTDFFHLPEAQTLPFDAHMWGKKRNDRREKNKSVMIDQNINKPIFHHQLSTLMPFFYTWNKESYQ